MVPPTSMFIAVICIPCWKSALVPGTFVFGKKLSHIENSRFALRLSFEDRVQAEAVLVIGADGLNSKVRDHLLGPEKPRYTGHIAHCAIFPATRLNGLPIRACSKWWGALQCRKRLVLVTLVTQLRAPVC